MRRKPGALLPIEQGILSALAALHKRGVSESHGYEIAQYLRDLSDAKNLTAYGTLYRALGRLLQMGILEAHWEDPHLAAEERRPARRLYQLTALGESAYEAARAPLASGSRVMRKKPATA